MIAPEPKPALSPSSSRKLLTQTVFGVASLAIFWSVFSSERTSSSARARGARARTRPAATTRRARRERRESTIHRLLPETYADTHERRTGFASGHLTRGRPVDQVEKERGESGGPR